MICFYVTGVVITKAISSFYYCSVFSIDSPQLLKATLRAFHWTQKALDQALGSFPANKLGLTRLATALQVWRSLKLLKPQKLSLGLRKHLKVWEQAGSWEPSKISTPKHSALFPLCRGAAAPFCSSPQVLCSPFSSLLGITAQQRMMDGLGVFSIALVCHWANPRQTACFISCVIKMRDPNTAFCTKIITGM